MNTVKIQKNIVKTIIDKMIPISKKEGMPSASTAINLNIFFYQVIKQKNILAEIRYIIKKYKLKHINDVSKFSNKLFETSKLKFYLGNLLMEHYFSSRKVNKILKQKINTVPFNDKKEKYEFKQLLKKVNNKLSLNEI
tara:strand:+ start:411 stop:824 length:414 start_codon:yes stop_codon:yes gene_type:complete